MCTPSQPRLGSLPVHQSHAGRPKGEPERARPGLGRRGRTARRAKWSGNGSSSASKRLSTPFRDGLLAGSDPVAEGGWGVHRHPVRCRSRHASMGGRSQPRPRWPDRHRRSGGRGTTASAPATYGTGGVSIADAISCPATLEAPCTLVDRHRYGRPAVKTDLPTDGSNATTGRTLEVETPSGYAFASAATLWRTRPPIRGR